MKTLKPLLQLLSLILLGGALGFLAINWELFEENVNPLLYRRGPALTAALTDFSGTMNEAGAIGAAGVPLACTVIDRGDPLGDRVCYSNISSFAQVTALRIAFFFRDGLLASIKIDVPWWRHRAMAQQLLKDFGPPSGGQDTPVDGVRLVGWKLKDGSSVLYNRDADRNPLMWNTVQWVSEPEARRMGGIFLPAASSR